MWCFLVRVGKNISVEGYYPWRSDQAVVRRAWMNSSWGPMYPLPPGFCMNHCLMGLLTIDMPLTVSVGIVIVPVFGKAQLPLLCVVRWAISEETLIWTLQGDIVTLCCSVVQ